MNIKSCACFFRYKLTLEYAEHNVCLLTDLLILAALLKRKRSWQRIGFFFEIHEMEDEEWGAVG